MEQSFTEISRPASRNARIGEFVLGAFFLGLIGMGSFLAGIMYEQPLYLAITFGAVLAGWMLFDRKRHHDGLAIVRTTSQPAPEQSEPITPKVVEANGTGNIIRYGKYALTRDQWAELAKVLFENDDRFVRDVVAKAKVFPNITKDGKWSEIQKDFERLGMVFNGKLTNTGIEILSQFSPYPIRN